MQQMRKIILTVVLLIVFQNVKAQEFSYGGILGIKPYDVEINGPISGGTGFSTLNVGGFLDYQINDSFGVRGNLIYSNSKESIYYLKNGNQIVSTFFNQSKIKSIEFQSLLRYDVNHSYNQGFYIIGGFRITNILNVKLDGQKNDDFYKKINFGGMLGFGVIFAKYYGIEFIPDLNISNTLNSDNNKARNFGFYLNSTINLDSIFNK
jgi:hypothetical protein